MQITRILLLLFFFPAHAYFPFFGHAKKATIMLDPAGDIQQIGRVIDDACERSVSYELALALKKTIEHNYPACSVMLSRNLHEKMPHLHRAESANRLAVDLYVALHCYQEEQVKPNLFLYTFSNNQMVIPAATQLSFIPLDKAHLPNIATTRNYANLFHQIVNQEQYKKEYLVHGVYALPVASLSSIQRPAFAIEVGIKKATDWQQCVPIIADGLSAIVEKILNS